jgi:hypothetical protein
MCPFNLVLLEWHVIGKMANTKILFLERWHWRIYCFHPIKKLGIVCPKTKFERHKENPK